MSTLRLSLAIFLFIAAPLLSRGQSTYSNKAYKQYPHWITMMEDTLSNYYEVNKAFDIYWSEHDMPKEEDQILGMKDADEKEKEDKAGWLKRLFSRRRGPDETEMALALKKYRHWKLMMEPWVQEDGSILTPYERKKVIDSIQR